MAGECTLKYKIHKKQNDGSKKKNKETRYEQMAVRKTMSML